MITTPAGVLATQPSDPAYVRARIRVGSRPCGVAATPTKVWVSNYGNGTVQWVSVATNQPSAPIRVGTRPCGLALGAGSVWVENYGSADVTRIDEATGKVVATIKVGALPYDVTFAAGAAWVTDYGSGTVSRIDARTNARTAIPTGGLPTGIAFAGGALWVGLGTDGTVARIDPATRTVTDRIRIGGSPGWTAPADGDVWVANGPDKTVARIDGTTRRVVNTFPVGGTPLDGDAADGAVWIPDRAGNVYRVDPATNAVGGPYRTGAMFPFVVAGSGTTLWVADYGGADLLRLDLAAPYPDEQIGTNTAWIGAAERSWLTLIDGVQAEAFVVLPRHSCKRSPCSDCCRGDVYRGVHVVTLAKGHREHGASVRPHDLLHGDHGFGPGRGSGHGDRVTGDGDVLGGQPLQRRTAGHGAVGDVELATVARAADQS